MLIPSIDLLGGKVVQLVRGERKALEFDSAGPWIEKFRRCPMVQLIDLDAAMQTPFGDNRSLVEQIARQLPCQVGGGVRSIAAAKSRLDMGARRVIVGSSLFRSGGVNLDFTRELSAAAGEERLVFAVDTKEGMVAVSGWRESAGIKAAEAMKLLQPYCTAFLYTHIDIEGTLSGFPLDIALELQAVTRRKLIVAGGVRSAEEIAKLDAMGVDAVAGMAIYTGLLQVDEWPFDNARR